MVDIECKEVIISKLTTRGKGTISSPVRRITQVHEKNGTLIAEYDPSPSVFVAIDLVKFSQWLKLKGWCPDKVGLEVIEKWLIEIENNK